MPIRDPNDAKEVHGSFDRIFDTALANRANVVRRLFVEVLDFERHTGTVSLRAAPKNVKLPDSAEFVARLDGFYVLYMHLSGVETDRVRRAEVQAAARLIEAQIGEDILLVVSNRSGSQLHIILPDFSGSQSIILRRMVVTKGVPRRTVVQQIANIYVEYRTNGNLRKTLSDAFDVEEVTRDFFEKYKEIFDRALLAITGFGNDEESKRRFTQTLFNRLMFVHFLSRKARTGWLSINGNTDYLRALWDDFRAKATPLPSGNMPNFYNERLRLLFFTGLNNPNSRNPEKGPVASIGTVPFLNGGLFEEGEYDRADSPIAVPDSVIEAALTELFERFNFTVMESTPFDIEVAVDPEMLGKIFEELVNKRHDSGAYYTPRPVVAFMCREALKGYLEGKDTGVGADAIAQFVDSRETDGIGVDAARRIAHALDEITVVDPACGSGAFLLGMMQELVELQTTLYNVGVDPESLYDLKLHIIERNLYGVDIDDFAVNISMLRLWLSLAIDFDGTGDIKPLPNLDFKIVTGDSLLGPDPSADTYPTLFRNRAIEVADKLATLKGEYMIESGRFEKQRLRDEVEDLEDQLTTALADAPSPDGAVDWRVQFAEVFARNGGFDVAIANPPYVRQENIGANKATLTQQYKDAATARSDLYCYFYARAMQLLSTGGSQVFVCSNSWLDVGYGARLQEYILTNAQLHAIYESAVERQFSTADINTIISVISKGAPDGSAMARFVSLRDEFDKAMAPDGLRKERERTHDMLLAAGQPPGTSGTKYVGDKWGGKYLRAPDIYHHILETRADRLIRLGDIADVRFGIKTGANEFFYLNQAKIEEWGIEPEFLQPVMTTPQESRALLVDPSTLPHKLFMCHREKSDLRGTAALAYIQWGEMQGFHMRSSTRSRPRWWDLGEREYVPVAINRRVNDVSRTYLIRGDCHVGDTLYGIRGYTGQDVNLVTPLNNEVFQLFYNAEGRTNFGQGVIEMEVYEVQKVGVVDPRFLPRIDDADAILKSTDWDVLNPSEARRTIDDAVFDALELTQGERDAVYEGVRELVENRLKRAKSV